MMEAASFRKVLLVPFAQQRKPGEDSPQYNGVAERQIAIIEAAGLAARIQAAAKYPNAVFPCGEILWVEQAHWACHALNYTATPANLGF